MLKFLINKNKKFLLKILFLLLFLFPFEILAKKPPDKFLDPDYVFKPEKNIKYPYKIGLWGSIETHDRIHQKSYALRYDNLNSFTNEYSLRFEKRQGDCGKGDCERKSKKYIGRSEIIFSKEQLNTNWYNWNFYFDTSSDMPRNNDFIHVGQFKMHTEHEHKTRKLLTDKKIDKYNEICPEMNTYFSIRSNGMFITRQGVTSCENDFNKLVIDTDNLKGKWHNIILNINWTDQDDGFIKLWINNKLFLDHKGKTISKIIKKDSNNYYAPIFRIGLYGQGEIGDQVLYLDNIYAAKVCKKIKLNINCKKLISQSNVNEISSLKKLTSEQLKVRKYYLSFIVKKISKRFNKSESEIENWIDIKTDHLPWVEEFNKITSRKEISKLEKFLIDEANKEFVN